MTRVGGLKTHRSFDIGGLEGLAMVWIIITLITTVACVLVVYIRTRPAAIIAKAELEWVRRGNPPMAVKTLNLSLVETSERRRRS